MEELYLHAVVTGTVPGLAVLHMLTRMHTLDLVSISDCSGLLSVCYNNVTARVDSADTSAVSITGSTCHSSSSSLEASTAGCRHVG